MEMDLKRDSGDKKPHTYWLKLGLVRIPLTAQDVCGLRGLFNSVPAVTQALEEFAQQVVDRTAIDADPLRQVGILSEPNAVMLASFLHDALVKETAEWVGGPWEDGDGDRSGYMAQVACRVADEALNRVEWIENLGDPTKGTDVLIPLMVSAFAYDGMVTRDVSYTGTVLRRVATRVTVRFSEALKASENDDSPSV